MQREIVFSSSSGFLLKISGVLLGLTISILTGKFFGAAQLGQLNLHLTLINFLTIIAGLGINEYLVYTISSQKVLINSIFNITFLKNTYSLYLLSSLIVFLFLFILRDLINSIFEPNLILIYTISLGVFFQLLLNANVYFLKGNKRIPAFIFLKSIAANIVFLILIFIAKFIYSAGFTFLLENLWAGFLMSALISFLFLKDFLTSKSNFIEVKYNALLSESKFIYLSEILEYSNNWLPLILAGMILTPIELGVYSLGFKITVVIITVVLTSVTIIMPVVSGLNALKDKTAIISSISNAVKIALFLTVIINAGIAIFGGAIFTFLGNDFSSQLYILPLLLVSKFFDAWLQPLYMSLPMLKRQKQLFFIYLVKAVSVLISSLTLIHFFGLPGAALASFLPSLISSVLILHHFHKTDGYLIKDLLGFRINLK
ncbi:MAG: oligosaccharide flippase family protein [Ignavibacteriaceae bacterium]|nr:oligosaccharide flippase family protein [Ignavibacteriaceae bacterium]